MLNNHLQEQSSDNLVIGYDVKGQPKYAADMKVIYDEEVKNAVEENVYTTTDEIREKTKMIPKS